MKAVALATFLGLVASPLVLLFPPAYFPWTLVVLAAFGATVGLAIAPRGRRALRALGAAAVVVLVAVVALMLSSQVAFQVTALAADPIAALSFARSFFVWTGSLLLAVLIGTMGGMALRARWGVWPGAMRALFGVVVIVLMGVALAFLLAPPEVANAPTCGPGQSCPRSACAITAERTRVLALERVTAVDGNRIICTYTAWGGIQIGSVDGTSWTDGTWPRLLTGR